MCGRFVLISPGRIVAEHFQLSHIPSLEPRYNIAPSQPVAVVLPSRNGPDRELKSFKWGLIPYWAKDASMGYRMINARSEEVADKPAFRAAFSKRRCLIPADGFYEWKGNKGQRTPYLVRMADQSLFAFAGLWERWKDPDGNVMETCTILTTSANELVRPIHHRMPVILPPEDHGEWLDTSLEDMERLTEMLRPYPAESMAAHPVSPHVNKPANDDPLCMKRIPSE